MSQETSSFRGKYYTIEGMVTNPGPVQIPRPPIMIAAMGPKMLVQAARHADIWNSLSFKPDFADQLDETRDRVERMRQICAEIGRTPTDFRWSFTLLEPRSRQQGGMLECYQSESTFVERVEALILPWHERDLALLPVPRIADPDVRIPGRRRDPRIEGSIGRPGYHAMRSRTTAADSGALAASPSQSPATK